ncbi:hypothetical protein KW786_02075 [Candidatus Parcubacteria bacterium]|nr:hypothetical protein [Candidatus Parcubacteria bacterium]
MDKNARYVCEDCRSRWQKYDYPQNVMFSEGACCPNCESRNIVVIEMENSDYRIYEKNYSGI